MDLFSAAESNQNNQSNQSNKSNKNSQNSQNLQQISQTATADSDSVLSDSTNCEYDSNTQPLAEKLRPKTLSEFTGQAHLTGINGALNPTRLKSGKLPPLLFWGPPGTGKTTLARLIGKEVNAKVTSLIATEVGAKKLREVCEHLQILKKQWSQFSLLFIDEVHRLNRAEQDVLLPYLEQRTFGFIGATTEHPSYRMTGALLSRCQVLVFREHGAEDLTEIAHRAFHIYQTQAEDILEPAALSTLCSAANGDARKFIGWIEEILGARATSAGAELDQWPMTALRLKDFLGTHLLRFDRLGDQHYDTISAFIKSVRGTDPDAALYYLAVMLKAGEDPLFIARRLMILASEDVGNADPRGLLMATSALQALEVVGLPEGAITLAQVTSYLASAPKSNAAYLGLRRAQALVEEFGQLPIPLSLRSSKTELSEQMGYGRGYIYSHDKTNGFAAQDFLPDLIKEKKIYEPKEIGYEGQIKKFLNFLRGNA